MEFHQTMQTHSCLQDKCLKFKPKPNYFESSLFVILNDFCICIESALILINLNHSLKLFPILVLRAGFGFSLLQILIFAYFLMKQSKTLPTQ